MNEESKLTAAPSEPPQNVQIVLTEVEYLRQIAEHLRAIRSMLSFFTVIVVVGIILLVFR